MRRLESEHLAVLAHRSFDFVELRAAARGDHQLRGLVGDDARVSAGVEHFPFERLAVEVLAAVAGVRPWPIPKLIDHDFASYSTTKYSVRSCSARCKRFASVPIPL